MKPLIGITGGLGYKDVTLRDGHVPTQEHYAGDTLVQAIERAGGIPVILPVNQNLELVKETIDRMDAVILSGGPDISPMLWGERPYSWLHPVSPRRDDYDIAVAEYILKQTDKPVLGICRGEQVMNYVMGGSMYVDLQSSGKPDHRLIFFPSSEPAHLVTVEEGTLLAELLGAGDVGVNSIHHQAINEAGAPFIASARSVPDQVVEAIEIPGDRFAVGIQWHPECMSGSDKQQSIFRRLVEAAKKSAEK